MKMQITFFVDNHTNSEDETLDIVFISVLKVYNNIWIT